MHTTTGTSRQERAHAGDRPGFTLVEMVVCLGIVALLCGILLPSLRATRESTHRLRCASNQRQLGVAMTAFADANDGRLPYTWAADLTSGTPEPGELMATRRNTFHGGEWEGIGRLLPYLNNGCECMYCPSHHGSNPFERWSTAYTESPNLVVYANYHYAGHAMHWLPRTDPLFNTPVRLDLGRSVVLLSDGLRTQSDFNHRHGLNRLFGDLSVEWWNDREEDPLRARLPTEEQASTLGVMMDSETFQAAWASLVSGPQ